MPPELPQAYVLIGKERHDQLNATEFNPALDGKKSGTRFSDKFNREIGGVMEACSKFLAQHGEFGSLDRYHKGLGSDWWIDDDFFSVSRVLSIDLLDSRMQTYTVIEGLRDVLASLPCDWMLMVGHDNAYDSRGCFVGQSGSYYFWIRRNLVEIYSESMNDLVPFYRSLSGQPK